MILLPKNTQAAYKRKNVTHCFKWETLNGFTDVCRISYDEDGEILSSGSDLLVSCFKSECIKAFGNLLTPFQVDSIHNLITGFKVC